MFVWEITIFPSANNTISNFIYRFLFINHFVKLGTVPKYSMLLIMSSLKLILLNNFSSKKGHKNKDDYKEGDWILVEHGRWSRGFSFADKNGNEKVLRIVEAKSVMLTGNYKPKDWYQAKLKYSAGGDLLE